MYPDRELQDQVEAAALYDLLERDVVPAFYDRSSGRLPLRWILRMKASLSALCCQFNTHRMVKEYSERFYLMADSQFSHLAADSAAGARGLASWMKKVRTAWPDVRVEVETTPPAMVKVGQVMDVRARIALGKLTPDDVTVELYLGRINADGDLTDGSTLPMRLVDRCESGDCTFESTAVKCTHSGLHGYTVRMMPEHPDLPTAFWPGLILWANGHVRAAAG